MTHPRPILALAGLLLVGCQSPKAASSDSPHLSPAAVMTGTPVISNTDPSALKLHDISGALLMYYATHKRLPASFEELQTMADVADGPIDAACPGSDRPYVYTADGIRLQDREQRIVVYEPAPLHNGFRQAITINEPRENEALQTRVIPLPESFFLLRPPESGPATPAAKAAGPATRP